MTSFVCSSEIVATGSHSCAESEHVLWLVVVFLLCCLVAIWWSFRTHAKIQSLERQLNGQQGLEERIKLLEGKINNEQRLEKR